jgi:putative ABC transport system ATP-binding protein
MKTTTKLALRLEGVQFGYRPDRLILDVPELAVEEGESVFVHGPSGSGKTTLLGLLAGVLRANQGSVTALGQDLSRLSNAGRDRFRGAHVGYIFQMFNLIPYLSVRDNIALPCRLTAERRQRLGARPLGSAVEEIAGRLGIKFLLDENAMSLSVGQQQRVAAARALIGAPQLVIADEPTSSLDHDHRARFLDLLFENCRAVGSTLVFVSHDRTLIPMFDRVVDLPALNRVS